MRKHEVTNTYVTGIFPDTVADNSSGAATPDGFEFVKAYLDNSVLGPTQAIMDYAAGNTNAPTGSVGVPNAVAEAAGVSQIVEAIHKMTGSGPGTMKPYYKADLPAVTGDRVLLLAEQGVLIASYPDLDAATWIGGDTAAQIAAEAAGKKFYRSSDAGGATGDAAGPYLQLPPNLQPTFLKQYSEAAGDFSLGGPTGWVTDYSAAIPYRTTNGTYRLILNATARVTTTTSVIVTMTGVTFKTVGSGQPHAIVCWNGAVAGSTYQAQANGGTGTFFGVFSTTNTSFHCYFDLPLDAKPTWADDFEIQWGITY